MELIGQQLSSTGAKLTGLLVVFLGLAFATQSTTLKIIATLAYLSILVFALYRQWASILDRDIAFVASIVTVCAYFSILGSVSFYVLNLSSSMIWILGAFAALVPLLLETIHTPLTVRPDVSRMSMRSFVLASVSAVNSLAIICIISAHATIASSQTPWAHLPVTVFILYGTAILSALTLAIREQGRLPLLNIYLLLLVALGVSTILYPLGYGFDPAIHQATEQLLLNTGTITPMPLFYMGHYALVTILATYSSVPVSILDTYLYLLLAVLLLPPILRALAGAQIFSSKTNLMPLLIFVVPYSYLIQSTPQSISFLFSLITILLIAIYQYKGRIPLALIALTALTAFFFHPLTGLPIMTTVLLVILLTRQQLSRAMLATSAVFVSVFFIVAVPLSLIVADFFSSELSLTFQFSIPHLATLAPRIFAGRIINFDDIVYTSHTVLLFFIALSAALGIRISVKNLGPRHALLLPFCALLTFLSAIFMSIFLEFNFSAGELNIFSLRLITLAVLLLYPVIFTGMAWMVERLHRSGAVAVFMISIFLTCFALTAWYFSYPRFDTHTQYKGYSSGQADYDAVQLIEGDAGGIPHVVLANQTVSAAAVKEFGFGVTNGVIAYYPIPTSGDLYPYFLMSMDSKKSAADFTLSRYRGTKIQRVYVVLNDYWINSEDLRTLHKSQANRTITIDDSGRIDIFIYEVP